MKFIIIRICMALTLSMLLVGCKNLNANNNDVDTISYELGIIAGFSEMVSAGVKELALSSPMSTDQMDKLEKRAREIAAQYNVSVFRESDMIITDLFSAEIAKSKEVLLLYTGTTLDKYLDLKAEISRLSSEGEYDGAVRRDISRRFGRLLTYSPRKINRLLAENTTFRTMDDFGIRASNLFLYYSDLEGASRFYTELLGLELLADYEMAKILRIATDSYLILVDATKGMHTADEPKTVALALLTDQLQEWYDHLLENNVKIKYEYNAKEGGAHDGFVAIDPEGYLLEFEMFKQHPENEKFIPLLRQNSLVRSPESQNSTVPEGLGFYGSITWLYYQDLLEMQNFFQDVLGLELVADQGWTKIYKVSESGFIGLVDERRGMHSYSEEKAVTISFIIEDLEGWYSYASENKPFKLRSSKLEADDQGRYRAFVGYDPEGYFLEFDQFLPHEVNQRLMNYLGR